MLHWNGATGGATEIIRAEKPRQAPPAYRQLQAPLEPLASHTWRDGERGHIGDTYSKGSFNGTDYKHGKKIQHHTRGPINHSAWRGGEKGHVADALNADAQPQPQQQSTGGALNSTDTAEPYKPIASHTWRDGERGHIGDTYTKGGFKGTDFKHGQKIQHHTRGCLLYTSPSPRDRQKSRMPSSA